MKTNPTVMIKIRDLAAGFFGWTIFVNVYFMILFVGGGYSLIDGPGRITLFLGLPTIVVPIIFFAKKRNWIGIGILTTVLISISIWTVLYLRGGGLPTDSFRETLEVIPEILFIPFPAGALLAMN